MYEFASCPLSSSKICSLELALDLEWKLFSGTKRGTFFALLGMYNHEDAIIVNSGFE